MIQKYGKATKQSKKYNRKNGKQCIENWEMRKYSCLAKTTNCDWFFRSKGKKKLISKEVNNKNLQEEMNSTIHQATPAI